MGKNTGGRQSRTNTRQSKNNSTRTTTYVYSSVLLLLLCVCLLILSGREVTANTIAVIEDEREAIRGTNYITMAEQQQLNAVKSKISVQGEGSIGVKPDLVSIRIGVNMERETAAEALRDNNEIMAKVSGRVSELGVEERDVMTSSVSLNPVYNYIRDKKTDTNKRVLSRFNASNQVTLRIRKLDSVGDVLGALVKQVLIQLIRY